MIPCSTSTDFLGARIFVKDSSIACVRMVRRKDESRWVERILKHKRMTTCFTKVRMEPNVFKRCPWGGGDVVELVGEESEERVRKARRERRPRAQS